MKEPFNTACPVTDSPLSLQQLIDNLVNSREPLAKNNRSAVINEVGTGVSLRKGNEHLIGLIDDVLTTVIANSNKGDIHISAETRDQLLILAIQERNNYNGYALSFSIGTLMEDAFSMGGELDIKCPRNKITTVYLSLPIKGAA